MRDYVWRKSFTLRLDLDVCAKLDRLAAESDVSRNKMIEQILERFVASIYEDEPPEADCKPSGV